MMRHLQRFFADLATIEAFAHLDIISVRSVTADGDTPLHVAAIRNDTAIAEELIKAGADVNARGEHGYTPLHEAFEQNRPEMVSLLMAHGADVSIRNDDDLTPRELMPGRVGTPCPRVG